jgi:hypothetical protein
VPFLRKYSCRQLGEGEGRLPREEKDKSTRLGSIQLTFLLSLITGVLDVSKLHALTSPVSRRMSEGLIITIPLELQWT